MCTSEWINRIIVRYMQNLCVWSHISNYIKIMDFETFDSDGISDIPQRYYIDESNMLKCIKSKTYEATKEMFGWELK